MFCQELKRRLDVEQQQSSDYMTRFIAFEDQISQLKQQVSDAERTREQLTSQLTSQRGSSEQLQQQLQERDSCVTQLQERLKSQAVSGTCIIILTRFKFICLSNKFTRFVCEKLDF